MLSNVLNRTVLTWVASILGVLLAIYTVAGIVWVPSYIDGRISSLASNQYNLTTHRASSSFNPFTFHYGVDEFRLNRGDSMVFSAETLNVNFDPFASVFRRQYTFGSIGIDSPTVRFRRNQAGRLNWQEILTTADIAPESVQKSIEAGWGVSVDQFRVAGGSVSWEDQRWESKSAISVRDLDFTGRTLHYPVWGQSLFDLKLELGGGALRAGGSMEDDRTVFIQYDLEGFTLPTLNNLLPANVPGNFMGGRLNVQGRFSGRLDGTNIIGESSGNVRELALVDDQQRSILDVGSLAVDTAQLRLDKRRLEVTNLTVDTPVLHLIRDPNGELNIQQLLANAQPATSNDTTTSNLRSWTLKLGPTRLGSGQFTFQDRFLDEEVRTRIDDISGTAGVVTSNSGSTVAIDGRAMVAGDALLRSRATVSPREPEQTMDLATRLRELSLSPFSPYSSKYIGHRIDGGKLNFALDYKIRDGLLTGTNELVLDRFNLGEQVNDSPVISAPVKLAVALLKDNDEQMNISIPVEGNLRKPDFQLQRTINQAIGNSIGMVVSSPFEFLAGMVGARPEELRSIDFDPGNHELKEKSRESLEKLAVALRNRPLLQLEIRPVWSEADRLFYARKILDRRLIQGGGNPDELVRSRRVLEQLFDRELSSGQRNSLLEKHTHQPEDSFNKELDQEAYVNQLYDRLLEATRVDGERLNELALRRAEAVRSDLLSRDIPPERLFVLDRKRIDEDDAPVSLRLDLSPGS